MAMPYSPAQNWWSGNQFMMPAATSSMGALSRPGGQYRPPGTLATGANARLRGGNPTAAPETLQAAQPNPAATPFGVDSLMYKTLGHNPSLSAAFQNGNAQNPQWWLEGGPDIGTALGAAGLNQLSKTLGLGKATDTWARALGIQPKATNAFDIWDTPANNAKDASKYDYNSYFDSAGLQGWYDTIQQKDPRGYQMVLKSYDLNQDGQLSKGEAGQWHWENAGQKEGRSINPLMGARPSTPAPATPAPSAPAINQPPQQPPGAIMTQQAPMNLQQAFTNPAPSTPDAVPEIFRATPAQQQTPEALRGLLEMLMID